MYDRTQWNVVTAWAEKVKGPGWSNSVILVLLRSKGDCELQIISLQPDEQTSQMRTLISTSDAITKELVGLVEDMAEIMSV
jgi:hypothetical protein